MAAKFFRVVKSILFTLFIYSNVILDTNLSVKSSLSFNQFHISSSLAELNLVEASYHHDTNGGRPAILKRTRSLQANAGFDLLGMLLLCGDISLNPGPRCQYPCGVCSKAVKSNQRGVQCDYCDVWYHAKCMGMNTKIYEALAYSSCIWECSDCGFPNFSSSLFESLDAVSVTNRFWPLHTDPKSNSTLHSTVESVTGLLSPSELNNNSPNTIGQPQHTSSPRNAKRNQSSAVNHGLSRKISILVMNFRSIMAKNQLTAKIVSDTKPDIIIGTETWLTPAHGTAEILISDSYNIERRDRETDPHGGVLIAFKKHLTASREFNLETNCELLWCKLKITGSKTLHVGAYYRPHEGDEQSLLELEGSLSLLREQDHQHHHIFLGGDFNFPGWDWSNHTVKHCNHPNLHYQFGDLLDDRGLTQLVEKPTRLDNTLDLAISNNPSSIKDICVIPGVSDHDCPLITLDLKPLRYTQVPRKIPLYNRAKWDSFADDLSTDIGVMLDENYQSPNDLWVKLKESINKGINKYIPHKTCKSKDNLPWITPKIRKMIKKRDKLSMKKKSLGNSQRGSDLKKITNKIKDLKRSLQSETRRAYWSYVESLITPMETEGEVHPSLKRFWTFVKHSRSDTVGISSLDVNGQEVSAPDQIANALNGQFQSVFSSETQVQQGLLPPTSPHPTMPDINISESGVLKLLLNLKIHKAAGPDAIRPRILKELAPTIAPILTVIYKRSYQTGQVPDDWKAAYVTPIFKKGKRSEASNYRPISLTCVACKIMEHILVSGIMKHANENQILYKLQCGFRERRSCETQLIELVHDLASNMQGGGQTDLVIMDFSKAFDKVGHKRLIKKIDYYGIRGKTRDWIEAFLSNRTQRVVVKGGQSDEVNVQSGVPQGSVLGPCLFLLYINDLPDQLSSTVRLFADDTLLYLAVQTQGDADTLQRDLHTLEEWERKWLMEFNTDKCQVLRVSRKRNPVIHNYTLHGKVLEAVETAKYLGVSLTSDLRWNSHITNITNKGNRTLGFLRRNLRIKSPSLKATAYMSLVRPTVEYSSTVWDPYTQQNIDKIEMVQRRAARYTLNRYQSTDSVTNMLQELNWDTLESRRKKSRLTMLYKFHNNLLDSDCHKYLAPVDRPSRHWHKFAYRVPSSATNYHQMSFIPRTIKDWNCLPIKVVEANSAPSFRRQLDTLF